MMLFEDKLSQLQHTISVSREQLFSPLERFSHEIEFVKAFAGLFDDKAEQWRDLILQATEHVSKALAGDGSVDVEKIVSQAEDILAPIGKAAKEYTIHLCGHAHIDMNWMWSWPETVNVTHDTFHTVNKLMEEFPEFHFSQSQASTYIAMQEYHPEIFEMIKKRVKEGRWEVTASTWVEGDKNIISGESLCRHLLYTRQYFKDTMGFEPEDVKIDWSPDTFGHAHTVPSILSRGGVRRYYHMRTGPGPWLYKWRSPDGSEILVFNDQDAHGYNGPVYPGAAVSMVGYVKQTGLKDFMCMYGVGDHGGGPTRRDLRKAREIAGWPVFPVYKLSTTDAFFSAVEAANPDLPVIDKDLNFIFEGCYTSQSNIKRANRVSETVLPEVETIALVARATGDFAYPNDLLRRAWRWTLFNHFHDILPGSGVHATYQYAQGLFQEIQATSNSIRTRALRQLASTVNTASAARCEGSVLGSGLGDGLGAGAGDPGIPGGVTAYNMGALDAEPVLIYNAKPWARTETVFAKVWNKKLQDDRVVVRDSDGNLIKGQITERGHYWGHEFATVAFKADVPALGYKVYAIDNTAAPAAAGEARVKSGMYDVYGVHVPQSNSCILENEYVKVEIDYSSGAISHLIDKETGYDYVPEGKLLGLLEAYQEEPHGMTAWCIGQTPECTPLVTGSRLTVTQNGPNRVAVRVDRKYNDSRISVDIGLNAGSRAIDFDVRLYWVERGTPETGVPMLKIAFPLNTSSGVPTYEIPFGSQQREQSYQEIPALKWADLSGETAKGLQGITLVNADKYGHSCWDNTLRLTLIRSSYDPDPLPEIDNHSIRFAVIPHQGACDVVSATRAGEAFNSPLSVVSASVQDGPLPAEQSFAEVLTPNVFVSAIKKSEDSDAVVIRLFETAGEDTTARINLGGLVGSDAEAHETDILERPLSTNTAKMSEGILSVNVPAYGQVTVKIG